VHGVKRPAFRRARLLGPLVVVSLGFGPPASADEGCNPLDPTCEAGGHVEDGQVVYGGGGGAVETTPVGGSGGSGPDRCTYEGVDEDFERNRVVYAESRIPMNAVFYWRECDGRSELLWFVPGEPTTHDALGLLLERVLDELRPTAPELVTSPPLGSEVLTGLPMYLAVDWEAFAERSGSVSAGQFTVTAVVRPVETRFVPGDDSEPVVCAGRGTLWERGDRPGEGDCTHTFTYTPVHLRGEGEAFEVVAQVVYEASYTVEGPVLAGTYELGTFEGPEASTSVPVVERRAVRTSGS
jgi:hypothetical protein